MKINEFSIRLLVAIAAGFVCAGIIFKEGISVHGLTAFVTVWCSSATGCLAAAGYYLETLIARFNILTINTDLKTIVEGHSKGE